MKVLVASFGTLGDLRPFVALGRALSGRGHDVTFCSSPDWGDGLAGEGFGFVPCGDHSRLLLLEFDASPRRGWNALQRLLAAQFEVLDPLVAAADVVLGGSIDLATPTLCEAHARPRVQVMLSPCMVPSSAHPVALVPFYGGPRWMNACSWWVSDALSAMTVMRVVDGERSRRGLGPGGRASGHACRESVLLPFPRALAALGEGAHVPARQVDAFALGGGTLPADLAAFLDEGPPPVYVGMGSMPSPPGFGERFAEAARIADVRMIVSGLVVAPSERIFAVSTAIDHARLFPRCAAIVHHGGAGTTIAAARAARPQVIVPRVADQHFHGWRVSELGIGRAVSRAGLSAARVARALREAIESADSSALAAVAEGCSGDGTPEGVDAVERVGG